MGRFTSPSYFSIIPVNTPHGMIATGGTKTMDGDYYVHSFFSSDVFTITTNSNNVSISCFLVAGGGGGGAGLYGGGGGGGGVLTGTLTLSPGSYNVVVGAGGSIGASGSNSVFSSLTAIGGGGGGTIGVDGLSGGSGGGGGMYTTYNSSVWTAAGLGTVGPPRQGYDGGTGYYFNYSWSGGGGGATGPANSGGGINFWGGLNFPGPGYYSSTFSSGGSPLGYYSSGGSGYTNIGSAPTRLPGGGGNAASPLGTAFSGGGGGNDGTGGSGIVILRYLR